jgi:uroporphyrinogen decarboxylase
MQTPREIFRKLMHPEADGGLPGRIFIWHWTFGMYGSTDTGWPGPGTQFWHETIERWHREGLPAEIKTPAAVNDFFGVDRRLHLRIRIEVWPPHEPAVIEDSGEFQVRIDGSGRVTRQYAGLRAELSMPEYLSYPITSRQTWERFARERLDAGAAGRSVFQVVKDGQILVESAPGWPNFAQARQLLLDSDLPVEVFAGSLFGFLREWMGLVNLCYALHDDEPWVQAMMDHLSGLSLVTLQQVLASLAVPIDHVTWWEDMAYKAGPLISPQHARRLMLPAYRRVNDYLRSLGVDVIGVDSDGDISTLIPVWLDAGLNGVFPLEVAAGMDVTALRARYGKELLLIGGIDKRALARGPEAIRAELARRLPVVAQGGYIPAVDHSVPHDIAFNDYVYYQQLLHEECQRYLRHRETV